MESRVKEMSDATLLAILIRTGQKGSSAIDLANRLLKHFGGAANLVNATWQQIVAAKVPGVGKVPAVQLSSAFTLVKRTVRVSQRAFKRAIELLGRATEKNEKVYCFARKSPVVSKTKRKF